MDLVQAVLDDLTRVQVPFSFTSDLYPVLCDALQVTVSTYVAKRELVYPDFREVFFTRLQREGYDTNRIS